MDILGAEGCVGKKGRHLSKMAIELIRAIFVLFYGNTRRGLQAGQCELISQAGVCSFLSNVCGVVSDLTAQTTY